MKKRIYSVVVGLCLLTICACQKDSYVRLQAEVGRYAQNTKLYLGENRVNYWSTHDEHQIMINGVGYNVVYTNDGNAVIENVVNSDDGFVAIYPADIVASMSRSSAIVNLPAVQNFVSINGKQQIYSPMAALTSETTLNFKNLCSLLCISVTNPTSEPFVMKEITVATANSALCGRATVTIDATSTISMDAPTSSTKSVTLSFLSSPDTIAVGESQDYYVVVPAFTSDNLTVSIVGNTSQSNYTWTKQATGKTMPSNLVARGPQATSDFVATTLVGSGTAAAPYQIANSNDLIIMRNMVNTQNSTHGSAKYILVNDIDCDTITLSPIGRNDLTAFKGHFNGNNHTIKISSINPSLSYGAAYVGLFGVVSDNAVIKNTILQGTINVSIPSSTTDSYIGGICALCNRGTSSLSNLTNHASINIVATAASDMTSMCVGGICGRSACSATQCNNYGDITATCKSPLFVGGIIGQLRVLTEENSLSNCGNTGNIVGQSSANNTTFSSQYRIACIGGIVGLWGEFSSEYSTKSSIINSFNNGDLIAKASSTTKEGSACCGGIVGGTLLTSTTIGNCYNTGTIESQQNDKLGLSAGILAGGAAQNNSNHIEVVMNTTTPICRADDGSIGAGAGIVASGKGTRCRFATYSSKTVSVDGIDIIATGIPSGWETTTNITATTDNLTLSILNGFISRLDNSNYTRW